MGCSKLHCTCIQALCIVCSNYSSLGISDGGETEGDPVCSTEEESSQEFTASLKQFRTVNPHLTTRSIQSSTWFAANLLRCFQISVQSMPLKKCSDYSLPIALGISNSGETEGEPVCSTGEECLLEKEESSGDSTVALGPHSTTGRHQHFISAESIIFLKEKEEGYIVTQSCLQVV